MYNLGRWYSNPIIPTFFCIILIFFVSFYLLELMLAVIMEAFIDYEKKEHADKKSKFAAKKLAL